MPPRPVRLLASLAAACALALTAPAAATAAECADADLVPDATNVDRVAQATMCLLNAERAAQGRQSLTRDARLEAAASAYSARMVAEGFFAHEAPDGSTLVRRLDEVGYLGSGEWFVGENLAWGQAHLSTPRAIVAAWMASPGHRANILRAAFRQIGIGIVLGTPPDATWGATYTTTFGVRDIRAAQREARKRAAEARAARKAAKERAARKAAARKAAQRKAAKQRAARRAAQRKAAKQRAARKAAQRKAAQRKAASARVTH